MILPGLLNNSASFGVILEGAKIKSRISTEIVIMNDSTTDELTYTLPISRAHLCFTRSLITTEIVIIRMQYVLVLIVLCGC